jgi:phenylalanyl-tRNA synthetase beta chain
MRVSLEWLREYVEVPGDVDELAHRLDMSGTKVEKIHRPGEGVEGLVVAEVAEIEPHPNADNLAMVTVSVGSNDTQRVVCGAKNFKVGDRVVLARVGARIPGMEITERKIRGEVSRGMLCSAAELGLSKDAAGLLILQPDAPLGEDVGGLLHLDDVILELEITPNRADCMSLIGIAREVAALYGSTLTVPVTGEPGGSLEHGLSVEIADPTGCPRYLAGYIEGITVGSSPGWMAARLLAAGMRPISNIVDTTNYVMLETGQPLHAFDAAKVTDRKIVVRRASAGESVVTLDGATRSLAPEDLLITDPKGVLAIAGVMGGLDSEVTESTTDVVLEAATFDPASVSFTSRRHNLRSEASARFERGTDIESVPAAAARATDLMRSCAGGTIAAAPAESYPVVHHRPRVELRPSRTTKLIGLDIPADRQRQHLTSIGIPNETDGEVIVAEIPGFRRDLEREADLIEEVVRLEGFDKIPSTLPPGHGGGLTRAESAERTARRALVALGLNEAWTSSFMSPADLDDLGYEPDHPARHLVELANPMVDTEPALRSTLLPGLARSAARNLAHRAPGAALFEIARVYAPSDGDLADEQLTLAMVLAGEKSPASWRFPAARWDFFAAKSVLEAAVAALGIGALTYEDAKGGPYHPTRAAVVKLTGAPVGAVGEMHPDVCERLDLPEGSVLVELSFDALLRALPGRAKGGSIPRFPSIYMDLAVVLDAATDSSKVTEVIAKAGAPQVVHVRLFDVYQGEQVGEGKKSLAYALELRDPDKTLTEDDATAVRSRILNALRERTGAELRA